MLEPEVRRALPKALNDLPCSLPLQPLPGEPMYLGMGDRPYGRAHFAPAGEQRQAGTNRSALFLVCLLFLAAAAVPAGYGLSDRPWAAFRSGLALTGIVAVSTALAVITWWVRTRRRSPVEVFRLLIGFAVLCWGIGQVVSFFDSADHVLGYPAAGDLVGFLAAPIGLLAIICLPRRSVSSLPGLRLVLDSLAVGSALTFALWRAVLTAGTSFHLDDLGSLWFVLADCTVFAAVLLSAVRDLRSRLWPTAVGVFCHVIADLSAIAYATDNGSRTDPWWAMAAWCLAWPLIGFGVVRFRSSTATGESARDRREATATQVGTVVIFGALLVGVLGGGHFDDTADVRGSLILAVLIILVLSVREGMGTHLRLRLTSGLRVQAFRDSLTGLPNRRALTTTIDELDTDDVPRVVLTLDLDGFKEVNDLLGHHAGDLLLIAVADALLDNSPPDALIARIGGDEFAVLGAGDLVAGRELAERLRAAVGHALALQAPGVGIAASVGVGRLVRDETCGAESTAAERSDRVPGGTGDQRDQLTGLVESAAALRAVKENGRDAVQVFDDEMAQARQRRLRLGQRLRWAIANRTIITYGQPIVDLGSGRLTGFESLARWTDDELGFVPPDEFIEVAEETGLVVALGEHLLVETLAAAAQAGVFAAGLTLSVNASPIQLRVPGFVDLLREQIGRHRIEPEQVIVEITEAILVTEGDPAVSTLAEINALGIGLAIDDFGTGYSALSYLRRLPVQVIKVDRSLTSSLLTEAKTLAIVEGVARMAHRMGIKVVMEGIEDELEADVCRSVGADRGQGYLFGRPTPWDQAAALIVTMARPEDSAARATDGWKVTPHADS